MADGNINETIPLIVKFSSDKAGLTTVGYTLLNSDGTVDTARTTTGVVDLGNGAYCVSISKATAFKGIVQWDTGEATPVYAYEDVNISDKVDATVSSRASQNSVDAIPTNPVLQTDARLNNLDTTVSSRAKQTDMTTALNDLTTIKNYTDTLETAIQALQDDLGNPSVDTTTIYTQILAIKGYVDELETRLTATRATNLDNLDATVSSRASQTTVDAIPINPVLQTDVRLNNLDATVSSRLASANYTAPDNTSIAAIKAKTDNLPADPASNTEVNGVAAEVDAQLSATHGAGLWGAAAGSGAVEFIYTLTRSDNGQPIADADVWVTTDSTGTNVVASGKTDTNGVVTFYLDAGTYYIWRQKNGYNFTNPDTEVVA